MQSEVIRLQEEVKMKTKITETTRSTRLRHGNARQTAAPERGVAVTPEERLRMIAESAYFRAERRGFHGGQPDQDWLEAESEIDQMLIAVKEEA